jgi:hypothetical protein
VGSYQVSAIYGEDIQFASVLVHTSRTCKSLPLVHTEFDLYSVASYLKSCPEMPLLPRSTPHKLVLDQSRE